MIIESMSEIEALPQPALGLLPAIHDATAEVHLGTAAPALGSSVVMVNGRNESIVLPAFKSWPPQRVQPGEHFGCDGRLWYPLQRYKQTNSYYPRAFSRTLFTIAFTPQALTLGSTFTLLRTLQVRLFSNNTDVVWSMVWEIGMRTEQASPAPVGPNLDGYVWREPLIEQQLHITDVVSTHNFGVKLTRERLSPTEEGFSGDIIRYDKAVGAIAAQLPTNPYFVLRIRLSYFDTQNDVRDPRGYVAYYLHLGTK
jgi:hypothetical protein